MLSLRTTTLSTLLPALGLGLASCSGMGGSSLSGQVSVMGTPLQQADITLWESRGGDKPKRLQTVRSNKDGEFRVSVNPGDDRVHYLVSQGGAPIALGNRRAIL